ncbi:MAG TPA: hypothetical protein VHI52_16385 [Verrucomicrobiae bacterium]|nr:hypothetical protein [Verrucomicrobiae bacterium]
MGNQTTCWLGAFALGKTGVTRCWSWLVVVVWVNGLGLSVGFGQIDPTRREMLQFGYNAALEGHAPLSAYAFYYDNIPGFLKTNLTLRLAVAPTYLDSELGFKGLLGENTDLGVGLAGGGFADSYNEIRRGTYLQSESFDGYDGEVNASLYHLFNPGQTIPLNGLLRGSIHYSTFDRTDQTARDFQVPDSMTSFRVRSGLRWGGREPTLFPSLAMELSVWYQGDFRTEDDIYGFGDRRIQSHTHLFWGEAFLAYTLPKWKHTFNVNLTAGTSMDADRLSAYRLGGFLPMVAEFPLSLPGYYYQELSARNFVLMSGNYIFPLDRNHRWNLTATAATAFVDYLPGLEQAGNWNSGVSGGVFYTSPTWRVMVGYGYGFDAIRSSGRGAQSIGFLLQIDLSPAREAFFKPEQPGPWRGLQRLFDVFGS